MQGLFSEKSGNERQSIYICTRLVAFYSPTESSQYLTPEYLQCACDSLNNGAIQAIFIDLTAAEELLNKKGTNCCIYEAVIPTSSLNRNGRQLTLTGYQIKAGDIQNIYFHPASPYSIEHNTRPNHP